MTKEERGLLIDQGCTCSADAPPADRCSREVIRCNGALGVWQKLGGWAGHRGESSRSIETKPPLHVWVDEVNYVVAESAEAALDVMRKQMGVADDADDEVLDGNGISPLSEWRALPDDKTLEMGSDDPDVFPTRTMTCAEWCRVEGPGYLGSSEY